MNIDPTPGVLLTVTRPSHGRRQLGDDREAEPRTDRAVGPVALPEVEALEGAVEIVRREAGPVVDHGQPARSGDDLDRAAFGGAADRVLDEVRERLQHATGVRDRRRRGGSTRSTRSTP